MLKRIVVFTLLFFCSVPLYSQIVNIESLRSAADSNGWYGVENFNVTYTKNTKELFELNNNFTAQYKQDKSTWLFLNTWDVSIAADEKLEQNLLFHARYGYQQNEWLAYEALAQYQQNRPLRIRDRVLTGGGTRFTLFEKPSRKGYLGTLILYEYENELDNNIERHDPRFSAYLSAYLARKDRLQWSTTIYYQPRIDYWEDFRTSIQTQLKLGIIKKLFFVSTLNMTYDAFPVQDPDIPNLTVKWVNGLALTF
ncbi:DUF481 domain-containing protein [Owenweeksia hongkongensis]|uniref:DUF481 domain-containing protein n=1 Tax=Owenweeksia hongkongensis TaxID=253245 RepID=UPI003A8CD325